MGARNVLKHPFLVCLKRHRAHFGRGVEWVAHGERARPRHKSLDEALRDAPLHQNAGAGDADLPAITEDIHQRSVDRAIEICVIKDDVGGFAAELEMDRREVLSGCRHHLPCSLPASCEGNAIDAG